MAELSFSDVGKSFGSATVLRDIDATVAEGEFVALLGPSGCGKTTLLRLIAGFETPDRGEIRLGGQTVASAVSGRFVPPENRNVGIVFQSYALWPHMDVARNVAYPLEVRGVPRRERAQRVEEALALTGLSDFAGRAPAALSGGQRQRVALARCLVAEPRAVLLDEPLANLDLALRASMQDAFAAFHRRTGATMVYVTHDQTEALALADRVAVMEAGRIRQFAAPETLYDEPASAFVAGFVGDGAVLTCRPTGPLRADGVPIEVLGQQIVARGRDPHPTHVCLRPDDLRLTDGGAIRARVRACTYVGGRFRLTLDTGEADVVAFSRARARIGDTTGVALKRPWCFRDPNAGAVSPAMEALTQGALTHA
ncbi:spermidine/putrescine ABC transporter ATP-binding protein (plasmid) [Pacificitalea manganoxidans]|uniref:Spermidine/putrescine ABC transporter ATP-binding protein n=1 Tax=Pacificitalea manganoxidans TaxID=1411902 RepID=A0A291M3S3_9RHOB|nr:ABC transporter ATP-binding protein [Pacificitalea manganoxidans]ATI43633.1 spermidine/putrescine ABC transporter ATP-binding protein [Pacificitalea manganoxidans]MDR6309926.1 iron(III) transport system ATP-binding protein [Pacificitalea manganoxidans]